MGKKSIVSVTFENEGGFNKKQLTLLKWVLRPSCVAVLWVFG